MKRILLTSAIAAAALTMSAFTLVVKQTSGSKTYESTDIEKITFGANGSPTLYLTDKTTVSIPAEDFTALGFTDDGSGVGSTLSEKSGLRIEGDYATVDGAERISLVDMSGRTVATGNSGRVSIDGVQPGVYVIETESGTYKIAIR